MNREHKREQPLLTIEGVNLAYGEGENRKVILRDVNASVLNIVRPGMQQGQVVGFLGPSGIGKTTLIKIIAGFLKPDSGTVLVGDAQEPPRPGLVGVVSQNYRVFPHMTVFDNLVFAGRQAGLADSEAKDKAAAYMERFDLHGCRGMYPGNLSGGQRQRLAILQQIMAGHQFICMDEPFSGLDVNQVHNVAGLIKDLTADDELRTIIVITHDIGAAIEVSDTLWLMGKQRDEAGQFIDGAHIVAEADLIAEGLAWDPGIRENPKFLAFEAQVVQTFRDFTG